MTKEQRLKKRHNAEKRFRFYGLASIFFALLFVLILVHNIFSKGSSAFMKTAINVEVFYDKDLLELEPGASEEEILEADFFDITIESLLKVYPVKNTDEEDALIELFTTDAEIEINIQPSRPHCACCLFDLEEFRDNIEKIKGVSCVRIIVNGIPDADRWTRALSNS